MNRVIVTVTSEDSQRTYDLELPVDIVADQLCMFLSTALKWSNYELIEDTSLEVEGQPPRRLGRDETLADAGVWDGGRLILRAKRVVLAQDKPQSSHEELMKQGGVVGWVPVDIFS
jgi:uncharacterized ubiquitin-like protein YukD